jgi:signal transduction histidine kinase
MAAILVTLSLFVYGRLHAELLRALDSGLEARAGAIAGGVGQAGPSGQLIADAPDAPVGGGTQITTPGGAVLVRSGAAVPLIQPAFLHNLHQPGFIELRSADRSAPVRVYALPINEGQPLVVIVASTLTPLNQTMTRLRLLLLAGDPAALALASVVAFLVTGAALRPMERMRRKAAAISVTDLAIRLPVPSTNDEVARLGDTFNSLLDRLQAALDRERRLLDDASHELRTPLSALKAELDLALSRERSAAELQAALRSASEETNRLARLAQDLLVLSRSRANGLAVYRINTPLHELLERSCARYRSKAALSACQIECQAPDVTVLADPMRLSQAIDNLLDNAVRYSAGGGTIRLCARANATTVTITVTNPGPGFPAQIVDRAFEPFVSGAHPAETGGRPTLPGAGLGLAIVQAVAQAHGGDASASNVTGGACVTVTLNRGVASASRGRHVERARLSSGIGQAPLS